MKNLPDHFFKSLRIRNYKSIKDITIADCNRINIFIGEPNVGKSNILEALVWLGVAYYYEQGISLDDVKPIIRFNQPIDLFSEKKHGTENITISVIEDDIETMTFKVDYIDGYHSIYLFAKDRSRLYDVLFFQAQIRSSGLINPQWKRNDISALGIDISPIKYYRFDRVIDHTDKDKETKNLSYLSPPFGKNLFQILSDNKDLKKEVFPYFNKYGLKAEINSGRGELTLENVLGEYDKVDYAFSTMADTLRRMIFYKAALMSNRDSILVFDEPEAHAFPTYISSFANHVAVDKNNNQFFISTHSPYIVNHLLDSDYVDDVNIYVVYFDVNTKQTQIKLLTEQDLELYTEYGADLFFNIDKFLPTDNLVTA